MSKIFDLSEKKSLKQAFLFYIVSVLICGLLAGVISLVVTILFYTDAETFQDGANIGMFYGPRIAMIYCFVFALIAAIKKSLGSYVIPLLLIMVSPILGFFFGGVFGMIPATVLSMYESKKSLADCPKDISSDNDKCL